MSVRIITDSGSDCRQGDHPALDVLPLTVAFGSDVYQADVDLSRERFYELLVEGDVFPSTGQVNPYEFSRAIARARAAGDDAVIVTLSGDLSGTHQSALTAVAAAGQEGGRLRVVDSRNVTVGENILVRYALSLVDEGHTADEIADALEGVVDRVCTIGLLDTLEYLKRGGRISAAAGAVGELLSIKPVVEVKDGVVEILGKARGSKNGRNLLNRAVDEGGVDFSMPLLLGYSGLTDALLRKYVRDSRDLWAGYPGDELPVVHVGAAIGAHVGPGAIAVAFFREA